jgi:hypothetical protein
MLTCQKKRGREGKIRGKKEKKKKKKIGESFAVDIWTRNAYVAARYADHRAVLYICSRTVC